MLHPAGVLIRVVDGCSVVYSGRCHAPLTQRSALRPSWATHQCRKGPLCHASEKDDIWRRAERDLLPGGVPNTPWRRIQYQLDMAADLPELLKLFKDHKYNHVNWKPLHTATVAMRTAAMLYPHAVAQPDALQPSLAPQQRPHKSAPPGDKSSSKSGASEGKPILKGLKPVAVTLFDSLVNWLPKGGAVRQMPGLHIAKLLVCVAFTQHAGVRCQQLVVLLVDELTRAGSAKLATVAASEPALFGRLVRSLGQLQPGNRQLWIELTRLTLAALQAGGAPAGKQPAGQHSDTATAAPAGAQAATADQERQQQQGVVPPAAATRIPWASGHHAELRDLANLAFGFAGAGCTQPLLFSTLRDTVLARPLPPDPDALADLLWAWARTRLPPGLLAPRVVDAFAPLLGRTPPRPLGRLLWAMGVLGLNHRAFLTAAAEAIVVRDLAFGSPQELANVVWAFCALGIHVVPDAPVRRGGSSCSSSEDLGDDEEGEQEEEQQAALGGVGAGWAGRPAASRRSGEDGDEPEVMRHAVRRLDVAELTEQQRLQQQEKEAQRREGQRQERQRQDQQRQQQQYGQHRPQAQLLQRERREAADIAVMPFGGASRNGSGRVYADEAEEEGWQLRGRASRSYDGDDKQGHSTRSGYVPPTLLAAPISNPLSARNRAPLPAAAASQPDDAQRPAASTADGGAEVAGPGPGSAAVGAAVGGLALAPLPLAVFEASNQQARQQRVTEATPPSSAVALYRHLGRLFVHARTGRNTFWSTSNLQLAVLASSFASAGFGSRSLFYTLARLALRRLDTLAPGEVVMLLGAYARVRVHHTAMFDSCAALIQQHMHLFTPRQLSEALWAMQMMQPYEKYRLLAQGVRAHLAAVQAPLSARLRGRLEEELDDDDEDGERPGGGQGAAASLVPQLMVPPQLLSDGGMDGLPTDGGWEGYHSAAQHADARAEQMAAAYARQLQGPGPGSMAGMQAGHGAGGGAQRWQPYQGSDGARERVLQQQQQSMLQAAS